MQGFSKIESQPRNSQALHCGASIPPFIGEAHQPPNPHVSLLLGWFVLL